jgi:hypothetical protein
MRNGLSHHFDSPSEAAYRRENLFSSCSKASFIIYSSFFKIIDSLLPPYSREELNSPWQTQYSCGRPIVNYGSRLSTNFILDFVYTLNDRLNENAINFVNILMTFLASFLKKNHHH